MSRDSAPRRSIIRDDEQPADGNRRPVELTGYSAAKPNLPVERAQHGLEIRDDGLDLDHQQDGTAWMAGQDVDGPALAVDGKRDLGGASPAQRPHPAHDLLDQACMVGIEKAIDCLAIEVETNKRSSAEAGRDPFEGANCHPVRAATLEACDQGLRDAGCAREVELPPPPAPPEGAYPSAETNRIHRATMASTASPPITRQYATAGGPGS